MPNERVAWVECPRDAWQGLRAVIPAYEKRRHLRRLLAAEMRRLDMGSFVSPKAVPQLADTEEVLAGLEPPADADLLCIVGNVRGVARAAAARHVSSIGYPLGISETFQQRNLGRSLERSWSELAELRDVASAEGLELVVYLSMGFGNPYGDPWRPDDTAAAVARLRGMSLDRVALADTVGTADPRTVAAVLDAVGPDAHRLGLHLHARPDAWRPLVATGLERNVRWFEGALAGVGGCPFAGDALVGNLPTERVLPWLVEEGFDPGVDLAALPALAEDAALLASSYA